MHERRYGALMKADRERREDGRAIDLRAAVESVVDMFETGMHGDSVAREQSELRRAASEALQGRHSVVCGNLSDRFHSFVKIEWRQARPAIANFGHPSGERSTDHRERISCHASLLANRSLPHFR